MPTLRFADLHRGYERLPVLRGVSAAIAAGEILLVSGPNGSGKSTLLRCLAGLLAPERGTIEYREGRNGGDEEPALDPAARRRAVGYVAPDLALYEDLTAEENLRFFARLRRVAPAGAGSLLARLELPPSRLGAALSSGMRQRLRWAWALLAAPRLLLLDEPLQNLDPGGQRIATELLAEHLRGGGLAVVATPSPHDLPDAPIRRLDLALAG